MEDEIKLMCETTSCLWPILQTLVTIQFNGVLKIRAALFNANSICNLIYQSSEGETKNLRQ